MEILGDQFENAVSNASISGEKRQRAIAAHTEVRGLLEADSGLEEWGIDTILIGSYARETGRYPGKDVDVFLRFKALSTFSNPTTIYDRVARVLIAHYGLVEQGGRVTLQARSAKIDFAAPGAQADLAFSVDAVPAVPWGEHWGIPNRDRDSWSEPSTRWVKTSPVLFGAETDAVSTSASSPTVGARNAYKPVVRLLRQVRHTHLADAKPGGLYVEIAAYYAWKAGRVVGDSWAELLADSLREVAVEFERAATAGLSDPILGTPLRPALSEVQWQIASERFALLASRAEQALRADACAAAAIWREILGSNDRGPVLPLPPGCGADGRPILGVAAVSVTGPARARGFARSNG